MATSMQGRGRRDGRQCPPSSTSGRARERRLARYDGTSCGRREIVECMGARGTRLVVDQAATGHRDRRLVAHLAADEPRANAELACRLYLESNPQSGPRCRALTAADLLATPFASETGSTGASPRATDAHAILVADGERAYRIEPVAGRLRIPDLRWCRLGAEASAVSLRDVVGDLEDYEPACSITELALVAHAGRPRSTSTLAVELGRVRSSAIVLNRRLRETVLAALAPDGLSMSEIAMRCGRVKRDPRGRQSGETSWLARRIGLLPEGGQQAPTPWIHSDVLGLIARRGLGVSPREVEL